jgi:DNA modification methylase
MEIQKIPIERMNPAPYNPRKDLKPGDPEYEKLTRSIKEFGYVEPVVWNARTGNIVGGHQRLKVLKDLGETEAFCVVVDLDGQDEKALNVALNNISGEWDELKLAELLEDLQNDIDVIITGFDQEEIDKLITEMAKETTELFIDKLKDSPPSSVFGTFLVPPFSIFDTRRGYWAERKANWLSIGIRSENGREENLIFKKNLKIGKRDNGTSVFDPVLCEICYRWFNVPGGHVFDPFAGGSVRGVIAKLTGQQYTGIDLRQEQVDANYANAAELGLEGINWICDDSLNMDAHIQDETADLVFTSPPYFDLEVYSDDPRDISNMDYDTFSTAFVTIMQKAARKLRENRFFIVVISDVRDKKGGYRDITGLLKETMRREGLCLYNDIVLLNVVGSAAFRVRRNMRNRKVVRVHQNVLVFYKGNPQAIQDHFEELTELEEDAIAAMAAGETEQ